MHTIEHKGLDNIVLYKGRKHSRLEKYEINTFLHCPPAQSVRVFVVLPHALLCSKNTKLIAIFWLAMRLLPEVPLDRSFESARKLDKHRALNHNMKRKQNV